MSSRAIPMLAALAALLSSAPAGAQGGPTSYYRFDDASGTVAWDSAGSDHGVISGGAAWVQGQAGWALGFDGLDDAVTFPQTFPFNEPGDATLLLWLRWNDDHHSAILWSRDGNGYPDANRFHLFSNCDGQSGVGLDYREESGELQHLLCATGLPAGAWHHVAITRRSQAGVGDTYAIYVNGALAGEALDATPVLPTYRGPWVVGTRHDPFMFAGAMDELALYPRALAADEIAARYQRSIQGMPYEGCTSWSLAGDFRMAPDQSNPNPDGCGTPVWSYLYGPTPALDPSTYLPFDRFAQDWLGAGISGWHTDGQLPEFYCFGGPCLPILAFNGSGADVFTEPLYWWRAGTVVAHPGYTQPVVIAFRAPFTGTLSIDEASFFALDWKCGDGVSWAVHHGDRQLGGGVVTSAGGYGPQSAATFSQAVGVVEGDLLFVSIGPNAPGDLYCDSTQVGLRLRKVEQVVAIDVRPGSTVNPVQLSAKGVLPAAVLGAAGLDAASVDPASLVLAGAPVARLGDGRPQAALEDVNGDGRLDLVAQFPVLLLTLQPDDTVATLTGVMRDGTPIRGEDAVRVQR